MMRRGEEEREKEGGEGSSDGDGEALGSFFRGTLQGLVWHFPQAFSLWIFFW